MASKRTKTGETGGAKGVNGQANGAIAAMFSAIEKKEKAIAKGLRPAASASSTSELRSMRAPDALVDLYASHDGSETEFFGAYRLLPVEEILSERATMNDLLQKNTDWQNEGRWNADWVPFLSDGDGQLFCVDPVGGTDGGPAGQIVTYDHETGPAREFQSFDVFVDLLAKLAKKGLLTEEAREEAPDVFEDAYSAARNVGLPRMPRKDLKKVVARLEDDPPMTEAEKVAMLKPLADEFPADIELWEQLTFAAEELHDWELMRSSAVNAVRLTPARDRPHMDDYLVRALHKAGRDDEAITALRAALKFHTNYPETLLPMDATPEFRLRWYAAATGMRPHDHQMWLGRGEASNDPAERKAAFQTVLTLTKGNESAKKTLANAKRYLELDRIATLDERAKLKPLLALAQGAESQDLWRLVAECATTLSEWKVAATAGARLGDLETFDHDRYRVAHFEVRALHELGRDDEALALLRKVLTLATEAGLENGLPAQLAAIPVWKGNRKDAAFIEKCFEVARPFLPGDAHA